MLYGCEKYLLFANSCSDILSLCPRKMKTNYADGTQDGNELRGWTSRWKRVTRMDLEMKTKYRDGPQDGNKLCGWSSRLRRIKQIKQMFLSTGFDMKKF